MKRLILIEHAAHFEVARSYALLFASAGWEVVLAVNEQNADYLRPVFQERAEVSFHILKNGEQEADYWSALDRIVDNSNLVIVCSHEKRAGGLVDDHWNTPAYLVIHDGFNYLDPLSYLVWKGGPVQWLRLLKYGLTGYFRKRKKLALQYDGWLTPVEWPQQWMAKSGAKKIVYLPFLWNESSCQSHNEKLHLVIPGTVNLRSRDYVMVAKVLEILANRVTNGGLKLTLLGRIKGKSERHLLYTMLKISGSAIELNYFTNTIDSQTFDGIMEAADLLWLPLHKQWQYGVVMEKGGISCLSGNIGDWVRFGKMAMIPDHYPTPALLGEKRKSYRNATEAAQLIFELMQNPRSDAEKDNNSEIFTAFNVQQIERTKTF